MRETLLPSGSLSRILLSSERLLHPNLSAKLTEIRAMDAPFYEKARRYEKFLRTQGCTDVVRFDCDVCVDAYLPTGINLGEVIQEVVGDRDLESMVDDERKEVFAEVERRLPEECKVRVEATTPEGDHTFCFDCDAVMCGNEVDYPDNPDWDEEHDRETREFLREHPEIKVDKYKLWGSTRRYICVDVLSENPDREGDFHEFDLSDGRKIRINYSSLEMIRRMGQDEAQFILRSYRQLYPQPE